MAAVVAHEAHETAVVEDGAADAYVAVPNVPVEPLSEQVICRALTGIELVEPGIVAPGAVRVRVEVPDFVERMLPAAWIVPVQAMTVTPVPVVHVTVVPVTVIVACVAAMTETPNEPVFEAAAAGRAGATARAAIPSATRSFLFTNFFL